MFEYKIGRKTVKLPPFSDVLTFGLARKTRTMSVAEQMFELVETAADEKTLAVIDTLKPGEMEAFFTAWQEHSGVTAGESQAS